MASRHSIRVSKHRLPTPDDYLRMEHVVPTMSLAHETDMKKLVKEISGEQGNTQKRNAIYNYIKERDTRLYENKIITDAFRNTMGDVIAHNTYFINAFNHLFTENRTLFNDIIDIFVRGTKQI